MKLKHVRPYVKFFKTLDKLCSELPETSYYAAITTLVTIPQFVGTEKYIERLSRYIKFEDPGPFKVANMTAICNAIYQAIITGQFDSPVLDIVYDAFMEAYHQAKQTYTDEDIRRLLELGDVEETNVAYEVPLMAYAYMKAILEENLDLFIKLYQVDMTKSPITQKVAEDGLHVIMGAVMHEEFAEIVDKHFEKYYNGSVEEAARRLYAKCEDGKCILDIPVFKALLYYADSSLIEHTRFETVMRYADQEAEIHNRYVRHLKTIIQGLQQKIDELASQGSNVIKVKVSDADKYMLEIEDLKKQIQLLQQELKARDELIAKLLEETETERVEPFETPVHIAYFGLRNNALVSELAKYNVQITFFDPLDEHADLGNFEHVVYNVNVAKHAVYYRLKEYDPILVSGSNAKHLAKRIVSQLKRRVEE